MSAFPLTGPHRALGHASNVARRSAAHNCGKHATPAVVSRRTVTASSSPAPIQGWTSAPRHQGVAADRDCRAHRADSEKIGAPIPLDQAEGTKPTACGLDALKV